MARQEKLFEENIDEINNNSIVDLLEDTEYLEKLGEKITNKVVNLNTEKPFENNWSNDDIKENNPDNNIVVVSPDVGGVVRSRALAKQLNDADLAIIDKRRAAANQSEVMNIIGDIEGKVCIVPDDIIDTAGTLCNAAKALKDHGAAGVKAYITHPVLSGPAIERLNKSEIDELVVTNSIPLSHEGKKCSKIRVISLGATIAECIIRLSNEESLSEMFI